MDPLLTRRAWILAGLLGLPWPALLAAQGAADLSVAAQAGQWVDLGLRSFQAAPLSAAAAVLVPCAEESAADFDCAYQAARAYLYLSYVFELAGQRAQAEACLGPATRWAAAAVARRPSAAQAHSLLADVAGRRVLLGGLFAAMRYGPLNGTEVAAAVRLDPDDPGVLQARGLRYLYAPALWGGDLGDARACFEASLKRRDSDLTRYFLALALEKSGDAAGARAELLRARAMNPADGLVRAALAKGEAPRIPAPGH